MFFSAIEGFGGVPPIRPLETLHNALSLRQLDTFLEHMTAAPLFRTPSSTPPKYPSTPMITPTATSTQTVLSSTATTNNNHPQPLRLQSPSSSEYQFPTLYEVINCSEQICKFENPLFTTETLSKLFMNEEADQDCTK